MTMVNSGLKGLMVGTDLVHEFSSFTPHVPNHAGVHVRGSTTSDHAAKLYLLSCNTYIGIVNE